MSSKAINTGLILITAAILAGCSRNPSKTYIEIRAVNAEISQKAFDATRNLSVFDLTNTTKELIRAKGSDFFRSGSKKMWLCISPEIKEWTNTSALSTNTSVYSRERFFDKQFPGGYHVGVDFSGNPQKLAHLPKWEPVNVSAIVARLSLSGN